MYTLINSNLQLNLILLTILIYYDGDDAGAVIFNCTVVINVTTFSYWVAEAV